LQKFAEKTRSHTFVSMGKRNDIVIYQSEDGLVRMEALKTAIGECLQKVDLNKKKQDFIHLLFNESNAERILQFESAISDL
jgi:hypothetical protein